MSNIVETWLKPSYVASEKMYRTTRNFFLVAPYPSPSSYLMFNPPPPPPFHDLNLPVKRLYHYNKDDFLFESRLHSIDIIAYHCIKLKTIKKMPKYLDGSSFKYTP